jgi:DNA-binding CsgD family transcriptional regulator
VTTPQLSYRQLQVLQLIADGRTVDAIAGELYITATSVRTHKNALFRHLGARSSAHAVALGFEFGLLAVSEDIAADLALVRQAHDMGCRIALVRDVDGRAA